MVLKGAWTALAAAVGLLGGGLVAGIGRLASSSRPVGVTPFSVGVGASSTSPSSTNTTTTPSSSQPATPGSSTPTDNVGP